MLTDAADDRLVVAFEVPGALPTLNEIIDARGRGRGRSGGDQYSRLKRLTTAQLVTLFQARLRGVRFVKPVETAFLWRIPSRAWDLDNVAAGGAKVVHDALVKAGVLRGDNLNSITGTAHVLEGIGDWRVIVKIWEAR